MTKQIPKSWNQFTFRNAKFWKKYHTDRVEFLCLYYWNNSLFTLNTTVGIKKISSKTERKKLDLALFVVYLNIS